MNTRGMNTRGIKGLRTLAGGFAVVLILAGCGSSSDSADSTTTTAAATTTSETSTTAEAAVDESQVTGLVLDPSKDYGNKYADGVLPVGDGKYVTDGARDRARCTCATSRPGRWRRRRGGRGSSTTTPSTT